MGIFATRKPSKLNRDAMLSSRPARNEAVDWETNDRGEVRITVTRQESWKIRLLSKLFYIPKKRRITLDEVGTEIWQMCNGRTSVGQMIESLSEKYQLNRKEAEVSLLDYLKTLAQKRFVGFMVQGERPSDRGSASGKKW
jgi:coenzyme PQQ synthesis protein D (PqqD)